MTAPTATVPSVPHPFMAPGEPRTLITQETAEFKHPRSHKMVKNMKVVKRLYSDGTEVYGCLACDYEAPRYQQVFGHTGSHNPERAANIAKGNRERFERLRTEPSALAQQMRDLADHVSKIDQASSASAKIEAENKRLMEANVRLRVERDEARRLLREAEKKIDTIQKAFAGLTK